MDIKKALDLDKTTVFESEWNGEKFSFTAKTNLLTPEWTQLYSDVEKQPENLAQMLADALTEWSIDYNGKPFPPNFKNLKKIPRDFLWHVVSKISETWSGNAQTPDE